MDAAFIHENQIIERYLMGTLPPKEARDFERWCRENPATVAQLGLSERINSALRLLDCAGEPLPWTQKLIEPWQKLPVVAAVAAVAVIAMIAAAVLFASGQRKLDEIASLQRQLADRPLFAVQSTRTIMAEVARNAPMTRSNIRIGGSRAELADFRFDLSWSKYGSYVVTIDRVNHGRVAVISNLTRDSNGHLRVGINSSLLGPGDYTVQIEGLNMRRGTDAQGWSRFTVIK